MSKKNSRPRAPRHVIRAIEDAISAAKLERASFGFPGDKVYTRATFDNAPEEGEHPDAYIKRMVRNHHDTWIVGALEIVLTWARGEGNGY